MKLRHILVKNAYEIEDLQRKLKEGSAFEELAQKFSVCPSSKTGGFLGDITKGQTVLEFEQAAFALKPGEISGSVRTAFGYHLIQRID